MDIELRQWTETQTYRLLAPSSPPSWQALAVEASNRRFYRLRLPDGQSLVVMSSPPALENNAQFTALATLFRDHGIGVPELLAIDPARGFFLMSDLGERHFADVYQDTGPAAVLPAALHTPHQLQHVDDAGIPPYTRSRFTDELNIYRSWCLETWLELASPAGLDDAFEALVAATQAQPRCCVHRDFHSRNLLQRADGTVGVVDFQDALMGPATYDLASLLRDCYSRFPEAEVARWRDAYLAGTRLDVDPVGFARDFDLTALQRQLKAVGIFVRLKLRDQRASHLPHVLPVLERIGELSARYPSLTGLAQHVADVIPLARARLAEDPVAQSGGGT
jgi:aminoglycoside/choline kinase family phosphotransferase